MKLLFKQRMFSWFDSYDIYDEEDRVVYTVKGQLAWGHCLKIFDAAGYEVGMVRERVLSLLPRFEICEGGSCIGCVSREISIFKPRYNIDFKGWRVEGNFFELDYLIIGSAGNTIARISKEIFHWTDTYILDIPHREDALYVLMFTLAIDAEKCSRNID